MSYRLTDVTELPRSPDALLTIVHPLSAVDIVSRILSPYTTASDPIENLDPRQPRCLPFPPCRGGFPGNQPVAPVNPGSERPSGGQQCCRGRCTGATEE